MPPLAIIGLIASGSGRGGVYEEGLLQALAEKGDRPRPRLLRGLEVRAVAPGLGAQEPMAGAVVDVRLVRLAELLHLRFRGSDGRVHARVVAAVVSEHGSLDAGQICRLRRRAVVDDGGAEIGLVGRVGKAAASAPAEADGRALAAGGGELDRV